MCIYVVFEALDAILSFARLNLARAVHNVMPRGKILRSRVSSWEDKSVSRILGNRPEFYRRNLRKSTGIIARNNI